MAPLGQVYRTSLALLTDLYELTMAYAYVREGLEDQQAAFHLFFRRNPFGGGYAVAAGLQYVVDYIRQFSFQADDLAYLATLTGNDGQPLFDRPFLDRLGQLEICCDVEAVPEGTVVFPHEPLLRVTGPIVECQILESPLLNFINFQTLIATKAARICAATAGDPVLEFGLRRAQGIDGALMASRAAYIGGTAATSHVLAGKLLGIPVRGTHAHSWVMAFDNEQQALERYADAMPNNCVFLVDTYDTLGGVRAAIEVGKQLRAKGHAIVGIRLDSGDLAYLSRQARRMLDEAGFPNAKIVASNDLDEQVITSLKDQGAPIAVWGVGTRLVTGYDQPALGGVYKLSALRTPGGRWQPKIKLSDQAIKTSTPGILQVRRYRDAAGAVADMIYDTTIGITAPPTMIDPFDPTRRRQFDPRDPAVDLLVPVLRGGQPLGPPPSLQTIRAHREEQLGLFHAGIRRQVHPHQYPVGLEHGLYARKQELTVQAREAHPCRH